MKAFLSLLTSLGQRVEGEDDGDGVSGGAQVNNTVDKKESALGVFVPAQVAIAATTVLEPGNAPSFFAVRDDPALPPIPEIFETGSSTIGMAGPEFGPIAPTISSPRWQIPNSPGNDPMAFAVRLTVADVQVPNVPEPLRDTGVAIRANGAAVSPPLQGSGLADMTGGREATMLASILAETGPLTHGALTRLIPITRPATPTISTAAAGPTGSTSTAGVPAGSAESTQERAANTPEAVRRAQRSASAWPADATPAKQDEGMNTTPQAKMAVVVARTESDTAGNSAERNVMAADTDAIIAQGAEIPETKTAAVPRPAREISLRLVQPESSVDIKVIDRAGSVRVAVRTADTDLSQNLQSSLSDLVHRLEHKGFEAEVWAPHSSNVGPNQSTRSNNEGSASQNGGKDSRDAQQGNAGQQGNSRNRPRWVAELEQKLATGDVE